MWEARVWGRTRGRGMLPSNSLGAVSNDKLDYGRFSKRDVFPPVNRLLFLRITFNCSSFKSREEDL